MVAMRYALPQRVIGGTIGIRRESHDGNEMCDFAKLIAKNHTMWRLNGQRHREFRFFSHSPEKRDAQIENMSGRRKKKENKESRHKQNKLRVRE